MEHDRAIQFQPYVQGVKDCIPTLLGYLSIGFASGVIAVTSGLSMLEIILLSVFLYAGSAQFIVAGMIAAGSPILSVIVTIFFVNARHLLLSAALAPFFRKYSVRKNVLIGSQLTDETFGVAINRLSKDMQSSDKWMLGLNITAHLNWIAANIAGAALGQWIPNPDRYGLDFALPAMFIGLLVMQMMNAKQWARDITVMVSSVLVFIAAFTFLPGYIAVMAAAVSAACVGMVLESWK